MLAVAQDLLQVCFANSTTWKEKYIKENMLTWDYKTSAEAQKLWEENNEFCAKTMKDMGVIK